MLDGFFDAIKDGLSKTRHALHEKIVAVIPNNGRIDEDILEEIESVLIQSDVGIDTSIEIIEELRDALDSQDIRGPENVMTFLESSLAELLDLSIEDSMPLGDVDLPGTPYVVLVVGVNGAGKTTTIGKLAAQYTNEGKKVLLAACDTFRAGAVAQLDVWAQRAGADIVQAQRGGDSAAVAFDAMEAAIHRNVDVLLIDTAGRLQNNKNLMQELNKIHRSIARHISNAPHETLLVLDATNGQNALSQARKFYEATPLTGLVLTKLDGTAKGGIVVALKKEMDIPVKLIGIGENVNDLRPFDGAAFASALFMH